MILMKRDLKPYPSYKDSSVPWMSNVPEHWEVRRIKTLFREKDERSGNGSGVLLSLTRSRGIIPQTEASNRIASAEDLSKYKLCQPGELVMNRMQAWSGMFAVSPLKGLVSPDYSVFKPVSASNVRYFEHLFKTPIFVDQFARRSKGIGSGFNRLYTPDFGSVPVIAPSFPEQSAIVRFLDHIDRRIRRYIRAKQKLIKLLEEQKQAIIHRTITRGLNPNVRLKPSGLELLGDVPEHWTLKRFKFLASVASGQVDPREPQYRDKILIAPNHIKSGTGKIIYQETAEVQGADSGKYNVRRGEIIYSKIRPNLRKAAIATVDCLCSADMYPITVRESELRPEYFLLLLLSAPFTKYTVDCSLRVAMPKVNREVLANCWMWYPSITEQDVILQYVNNTNGPTDKAISRTEKQIDLIQEYRTRIIADVVTGKLDVREDALQLPDIYNKPEWIADGVALPESDDFIGGEELEIDAEQDTYD